MIERKWLAVQATPLTSDGSAFGVVKVADTAGFRTKQIVFLISNTKQPIQLQVQEVADNHTLYVGPVGPKVGREYFSDVSAYIVADIASIAAPEQNKLANPPDKDHYNAIYESDPVVADRVILVDQYGKLFGDGNPLPIAFDGTVNVGNVTIQDDDGDELGINPDGSINVNVIPSTNENNLVVNRFGSASAVASGATTTIVQYTVPLNKKAILQKSVASGENIGTYTLSINGATQGILRTYFTGPYNVTFDFVTGQENGLVLQPGDNVKVEILHNRPFIGNFDARIQVFEILQ